MTPEVAKLKCRNFLATLVRISSGMPAFQAHNVRTLMQALIDGAIDAEIFTVSLQHELMSSPQPSLLPFLKKSLPHLQSAMLSGELKIDSLRAPRSDFTEQERERYLEIRQTGQAVLRIKRDENHARNHVKRMRHSESSEARDSLPAESSPGTSAGLTQHKQQVQKKPLLSYQFVRSGCGCTQFFIRDKVAS